MNETSTVLLENNRGPITGPTELQDNQISSLTNDFSIQIVMSCPHIELSLEEILFVITNISIKNQSKTNTFLFSVKSIETVSYLPIIISDGIDTIVSLIDPHQIVIDVEFKPLSISITPLFISKILKIFNTKPQKKPETIVEKENEKGKSNLNLLVNVVDFSLNIYSNNEYKEYISLAIPQLTTSITTKKSHKSTLEISNSSISCCYENDTEKLSIIETSSPFLDFSFNEHKEACLNLNKTKIFIIPEILHLAYLYLPLFESEINETVSNDRKTEQDNNFTINLEEIEVLISNTLLLSNKSIVINIDKEKFNVFLSSFICKILDEVIMYQVDIQLCLNPLSIISDPISILLTINNINRILDIASPFLNILNGKKTKKVPRKINHKQAILDFQLNLKGISLSLKDEENSLLDLKIDKIIYNCTNSIINMEIKDILISSYENNEEYQIFFVEKTPAFILENNQFLINCLSVNISLKTIDRLTNILDNTLENIKLIEKSEELVEAANELPIESSKILYPYENEIKSINCQLNLNLCSESKQLERNESLNLIIKSETEVSSTKDCMLWLNSKIKIIHTSIKLSIYR